LIPFEHKRKKNVNNIGTYQPKTFTNNIK